MTQITNIDIVIEQGPSGPQGLYPQPSWSADDVPYVKNTVLAHDSNIWLALRETSLEPSMDVPEDWAPWLEFGGFVSLDENGKIAVEQLPAIAITDVSVVGSQAAMLALAAQQGDVAVRTDLNRSFVLANDAPGTLANWKELLAPTDAVLSVAGLTGAITDSGLRTALGLGTAAAANTGTSGSAVPLLNGDNTWSGTNAHGVMTGTSLALGGASLGTNALAVAGTVRLTASGAYAIDARSNIAPFRIQSTATNGFSAFDVFTSSNVLAGGFGYGNSAVGGVTQGKVFVYSAGNDFVLTNGTRTDIGVTGSSGAVQMGGALAVLHGTAVPAGGTAGAGYKFSSTANFGIFFGSGAPTLSAAKGSLYLRSDGSGSSDRAYINTDGGSTWTALTTAA